MEEIYKNLDLENLECEEWRDIEGYNGKYQVSSLGRVKSLRDNNGNPREKIRKQSKDKDGYLVVILLKKRKPKSYRVHRLVASAFLENPNGYTCVNHKDECKTNNCVNNLEWCTQKYNLNYGNAQQRRVASTDYKAIAEKQRNRQDQSKRVFQYSLDGTLVAIYPSTREASRNGYSSGNISACCRNCHNREGNNIYKNYIWSYTPIDSK